MASTFQCVFLDMALLRCAFFLRFVCVEVNFENNENPLAFMVYSGRCDVGEG